jgi:hypothetical protein
MTLKESKIQPSMEGPANYRILVRGRLDESWSSCMGGMNVVEYQGAGSKIITVLQGILADQAALSGVLNTLYQLHLPVISAQCLDVDSSETNEE